MADIGDARSTDYDTLIRCPFCEEKVLPSSITECECGDIFCNNCAILEHVQHNLDVSADNCDTNYAQAQALQSRIDKAVAYYCDYKREDNRRVFSANELRGVIKRIYKVLKGSENDNGTK